jgi:hypothetical protein
MILRSVPLGGIAKSAALVGALGLAAGCGSSDDNGGALPDGGGNGNDLDADVPEADACVPGHGEICPGDLNLLELPEGGEVRIEFFELGFNQEELLNATEAYFYRDQTPATRDIFGPLIEITREAGDELPDSTVCLDGRAGVHYNLVQWPENQAIADTRTYLDVGDSVKLVQRDGDLELEMVRSRRDEAPFNGVSRAQGKIHDIIYLVEDAELEGEDEYIVPQNTWFDFEVPGSIDLPAFEPTNGMNFVDGSPLDSFGLFFPSRYTHRGPDPDGDFADDFEQNYFERGVAYVEGEDFTFNVPLVNEPGDDDPASVYIAALFNEHNGVYIYCLNTNAREEGTVTVPREIVELLPAEEDGGARRGRMSLLHITHFGYALNGRQFHVMGMACKTSFDGWCVVDEADDRVEGYFCPEGTFEQSDLTATEKMQLLRQVNAGARAAYEAVR